MNKDLNERLKNNFDAGMIHFCFVFDHFINFQSNALLDFEEFSHSGSLIG